MNITDKFEQIETLKGKIDALGSRKDWDDAFFRKVKVDFTYNSNKLEGNTLTYGQTIKLLRDFVAPKDAASRELLDMINHQKILDIVFANYRSQRIHTYMLPGQVSEATEKLILDTNELLKNVDVRDVRKHPVTIATYFHQEFLNVIHPFSDGNGRIGRVFTNLILLKNGYPPVFIKEVNKDEYLKCFELSDNDMEPMLDFMADRLIESLEEKWEFVKSKEYEQ